MCVIQTQSNVTTAAHTGHLLGIQVSPGHQALVPDPGLQGVQVALTQPAAKLQGGKHRHHQEIDHLDLVYPVFVMVRIMTIRPSIGFWGPFSQTDPTKGNQIESLQNHGKTSSENP